MSYQLTVFPYLGRKDKTTLWGTVHLWNYLEHSEEYIPDPQAREKITRVINMYEHPEWVNILSLDQCPINSQSISPTIIRTVQLLLMISTCSKGNVILNDRHWSSADNFSMTALGVSLTATAFKYRLNPIFKRLDQTFPITPHSLQTPKNIALRSDDNIPLDEDLLKALIKLRKKNHKLMNNIYNSLEMMFTAMLNVDLIPQSTVLICLVAAFENLFVTNRQGVKNNLDTLFAGERKFRTKFENRGVLYNDQPRTSVAIWYEYLCRARNRLAHGQSIREEHANYHGQSHRYIALLVLISCIKEILANELGVNLSGRVKRIRHTDGTQWFVMRNH